MIVFTAIFGDYDELHEPLVLSPGVHHICFTDKPITSQQWEIRKVHPRYDPVRSAREVKIRIHKYLPFYEGKTLWVDANLQIKKDLSALFKHSSPFTLLKHPDRSCIYDEARECMRLNKDNWKTIQEQMNEYYIDGFPKNQGLVATGVMIRENKKHIADFCELWFQELLDGSRRDQLSFNYVNWKNPVLYDTLSFSLINEYFNKCKHKTK